MLRYGIIFLESKEMMVFIFLTLTARRPHLVQRQPAWMTISRKLDFGTCVSLVSTQGLVWCGQTSHLDFHLCVET